MKSMTMLSIHLESRIADLIKAKKEGYKIVGYTPGGYLPEELIIASGAIPICLIRGGDHQMIELANAYVCRWLDPFCKVQIGYGISREDPYYDILDLLIIPITDCHMETLANVLDCNAKLELFSFGVPHIKDKSSFDYYYYGLTRVKSRLEKLTGTKITKQKLNESIHLCNEERKLLRKISQTRKSTSSSSISSKDFIFLNHGSFLADKSTMLEILKVCYEEVKEKPLSPVEGVRILLTGSTLALGDNKIIDLIGDSGGNIVIEEFAEGIRPYWKDIKLNSDPMKVLANYYFMERIPPAWFRDSDERHNFLIKLVDDFKVDGIIWYQLMYRESYKIESYYFPLKLKQKNGLSMITLESDYDSSELGQLKTRIEAFIEMIRN